MDIKSEACKRAFVTNRNAVTTAVKKKTLKRVDCCGRERSEMLMEKLGRNVTPCLHNSFCRNRETNVDPLPSTSNSVRITTDVLQDTKTESKEAMSQEEEMEQ